MQINGAKQIKRQAEERTSLSFFRIKETSLSSSLRVRCIGCIRGVSYRTCLCRSHCSVRHLVTYIMCHMVHGYTTNQQINSIVLSQHIIIYIVSIVPDTILMFYFGALFFNMSDLTDQATGFVRYSSR